MKNRVRDFYDVVVVGAGPAGTSAAYILARQGVPVILLEKAQMPRYKPCGAGLVPRAINSVPFDISEAVEHECCVAELNLLDVGMSFSVVRELPMVSMTMREKFDYLLFQKAIEAGAVARDDCKAEDIEGYDGGVKIKTSYGSIHGRFLVACDGALGRVAQMAGWKETRNLFPVLEWEVYVPPAIHDRFRGRARFEFGYFPSGYAWIFPKKEHLSIGLGGRKRLPGGLGSVLERYIRHTGIDRIDRIEKHGYVIPFTARSDNLVKGRVMLAGDSAGFVDPVTAEGITFAIRSGQAAGRAIVDGDFNEEQVSKRYKELLKDMLGELRWGRPLHELLYGPAGVRNLLFRLYGQRLTEAVADVLSGKRSYREIMASPSSYLGLLRGGNGR